MSGNYPAQQAFCPCLQRLPNTQPATAQTLWPQGLLPRALNSAVSFDWGKAMVSRWFPDCDLVERFSHSPMFPRALVSGERWVVWDWDQRRPIDVLIPHEADEKFIYEALSKFIDTIPLDVARVELDEQGVLVSTSSNPHHAHSWIPFYPLRTEFPQHVATLRRQDLTEVDRLGRQVDLVTYSPQPGETRQAVFKYYISEASVAMWWHQANCAMRMPPHPNIVPFDALVVDSIDAVDRVVGFTTRYRLHSERERHARLRAQVPAATDQCRSFCPFVLIITLTEMFLGCRLSQPSSWHRARRRLPVELAYRPEYG